MSEDNAVTLYDYYYIQFGYPPPSELAERFKEILINSPQGKTHKRTIDAGAHLMTTMMSQQYDKVIVGFITAYLGGLLTKSDT